MSATARYLVSCRLKATNSSGDSQWISIPSQLELVVFRRKICLLLDKAECLAVKAGGRTSVQLSSQQETVFIDTCPELHIFHVPEKGLKLNVSLVALRCADLAWSKSCYQQLLKCFTPESTKATSTSLHELVDAPNSPSLAQALDILMDPTMEHMISQAETILQSPSIPNPAFLNTQEFQLLHESLTKYLVRSNHLLRCDSCE